MIIFSLEKLSMILSALQTKTDTRVNSVDPDEKMRHLIRIYNVCQSVHQNDRLKKLEGNLLQFCLAF